MAVDVESSLSAEAVAKATQATSARSIESPVPGEVYQQIALVE
jgi:hypothetical protein